MVARGEAQLRTGTCIVCGEVTTAHPFKGSTAWYVPMYCRECVEYRIRMTASRIFSVEGRRQRKVYSYCIMCLAPKYVTQREANAHSACGKCGSRLGPLLKKARGPWAGLPDIERRRNNGHIRRVRLRHGITGRVSVSQVAGRDGWRCHVCTKRVTRSTWSVDHLVPIAKGGSHTYENVALAHRNCNSRRHTNGIAQLRLLA
jgi:hypothetical protein